MFRKVIVGIDGRTADRDAIGAARAIAPEAELQLVSVYPGLQDSIPSDLLEADDYGERLKGDAVRTLEGRRDAFAPGAPLFALASSSTAHELKRFATEQDADLLVLGAPEHGPIGRVILGDVARGVLHGSPCPVLAVARGRSASAIKPSVIGVAYDGSAESELALETAVELAADLGARLDIVEAVDISASPRIWGPMVAEYLESLVGPADMHLRDVAAGLSVPAVGSAVRGRTDVVLHELAKRVDLLVCGSRGWGVLGTVALGGVADRLVHHSPCPVLVTPRGIITAAEPADHAGEVTT